MSNYIQSTHRDIAWFKQAFELGQLEMRPPFQRNPVWTTKQKSFLIDTILNSYPIPEVYMQDIVDDKGQKKYIVVDGQQRLTACLEYIMNHFSIDSKDSPSFADLSFDDLSSDQKKKIYAYSFVVRLLPDMGDFELREIFQRLNRNTVTLNPQELRQATYWGAFIQTMIELADLEIWRKLDIFSANDIKRMLNVEFVSELTISILHGLQNKKVNIDKYYELYEQEFPERDSIKETFDLVLRELINVFPDFGNTRWAKKTDFYTLFLVFVKHKQHFPMNAEKRLLVNNYLFDFADKVNIFVSVENEDSLFEIDENIIQYAINLRASSDLGARRKREEALEMGLLPLLSKENA